ncbi:hypothetical protein DL95DRAFT_418972 [Leptodontidium sp. 2 PMI_412]|nr:hypothetical protein DL95DRAFT_418972 [Leptodontidium sp. 2 PMI_412]
MMIPSTQTFPMLLAIFATGFGTSFAVAARSLLQVETFIHEDVSLNMVSSLVIGSEAAVLVDLPSQYQEPKISVHDARTVLDAFPNATFYANPETAGGIAFAAPLTSAYWSSILGQSEVVQNFSIPQSFPFSFFALPGDSDDILHLFMADMLTPALTASWISTLDFLSDLKPDVVIPGHALPGQSFAGSEIVKSTKKYLEFWQRKVEAKGLDYYTPQQLSQLLDSKFPGRNGSTSELMLNITAENFGRGGTRFGHTQNLTVYTDEDKLNGWDL